MKKKHSIVFALLFLVLLGWEVSGQASYSARFTPTPPVINGRLDDDSWSAASWTNVWSPLSQKDSSHTRPKAKIIWDQNYLYIGIHIEEGHITVKSQEARQLHRYDSLIEIFLDPNGDARRYHETQINPVNTVWQLLLPKSYREGGIPIDPFDLDGFTSAVYVNGTINDDRDLDESWSVEIAIPWDSFKALDALAIPPRLQDVWRINLANVSQTVRGPAFLSWSAMATRNLHDPINWGYLHFSR